MSAEADLDRLLELAGRFMEQELSEKEVRELEAILAGSAEARRRYLSLALIQEELFALQQTLEPKQSLELGYPTIAAAGEIRPASQRRNRRRSARAGSLAQRSTGGSYVAAIAAAVILVGGIASLLLQSPNRSRRQARRDAKDVSEPLVNTVSQAVPAQKAKPVVSGAKAKSPKRAPAGIDTRPAPSDIPVPILPVSPSKQAVAQAPEPASETPELPASDVTTERPFGRIARLDGSVLYARGAKGKWTKAVEGIPLLAGDRLNTGTGWARMDLAGGSAVLVNKRSLLRLRAQAAAPTEVRGVLVEVTRGEVYVTDVGTQKVSVETPEGIFTPVGTRFNVKRVGMLTQIVVAEGAVQARSAGTHHSVRVEAGQQCRLRRAARPSKPRRADVKRVLAWTRLIPSPGRRGLQVLYTFREGRGDRVRDRSGIGNPIDLKIENVQAVRWLDEGLEITEPTVLASQGPAQKLIAACMKSNAVTLEAWLTPSSDARSGLPRIVTLANDDAKRQNFIIVNEKGLYGIRLRTTETTLMGSRANNLFGTDSFLLSTAMDRAYMRKTHLVFTRDASGEIRLYIDGALAAQARIGGTFANWDRSFRLTLGNQHTTKVPRAWTGRLYGIAVYSAALSAREVARQYEQGPRWPSQR